MNMRDFEKICNLLPSGYTWGCALTPDVALHIVQAALASQAAELSSNPLQLPEQAQQPTKELFSLYSAVNNLVAHIGMAGEITSKHDLVDAVMNSLYDLDGGNVAKRADDLIEKAFMPQSQALKLAVNEYIAKESK